MFAALQKRLGKVTLKTALIFTLINTFFLLFFKDIFIRVGLFLVCAIILFFLGRVPFIDLDPVPFVAGIHFIMFGYVSTIQFIVWTIPASDVIANRFNQWSFVNFASLAISITLAIVFKDYLKIIFILYLILVLHNLFRIIITLRFMKGSIQDIKGPLTNTIAYVVLINVFSYFLV